MKNQRVEFLEPVEHDLNYARDFYDSWLTGGADKFLARFREAVTWIEWNPEQFPVKHRFLRGGHYPADLLRHLFRHRTRGHHSCGGARYEE